MAQVTFTVPDAQLNRVLDGFSSQHDYRDEIRDPEDRTAMIPNPESKAAFLKRKVIEYVLECVKVSESLIASNQAIEDAETSVDNEVTIT